MTTVGAGLERLSLNADVWAADQEEDTVKLTELLTPAVRALLDAAPRAADGEDSERHA